MIKKVYSIFDSCVGLYSPPMAYVAEGEVVREFLDLAVSAESKIGAHPEHYSLYYIGQFDDSKGEIIAGQKVCVITAQEAVAQAQGGAVPEPNLEVVSPGGSA
jgi:hypothetical protein